MGGHVFVRLQADHLDRGSAVPECRAGDVDGHIPAPDHHDALLCNVQLLAQFGRLQKIGGPHHARQILSGNAQFGGLMGADREEYGIVALGSKRLEVIDAPVGHYLDADLGDVGHVLVHHLVGQAVRRQRQTQHAAGLGRRFEDGDLVPLPCQMPGGGETGRARSDDRHFLAVGRRDVDRPPTLRVVGIGYEPFEPADGHRAFQAAARAFRLARRITRSPQTAHQGGGFADELEGLLVLPAADESHVPMGLDARRAVERAR